MFQSIESVLQRLPEAVIVTDEVGTVLWGNEKMIELVGGELDSWIGTSILDGLHADSVAMVVSAISSMCERDVGDEGTLLRLRLRTADGGYREVESRGSFMEVRGKRVLVNVLRTLEDRHQSDVHGGDGNRLLALVDHSPSILALIDEDRRVVSVSSAATRLLGHDVVHIRGDLFEDHVAEHHRDLLRTALDEMSDHLHLTLDLPAVNGTVLHFDAHITDLRSDPDVAAYVATLTDVSDLKIAEHRLRHLANHDSLTGTLNRRAFSNALSDALSTSEDVAVLFLDLDRFKDINDRHGHLAGDAVLVEFGARLERLVRGADLVGRLGGDEFAVALIGDSRAGSKAIARRISEVSLEPIDIGSQSVTVGVSIGCAYAKRGAGASSLLRCADDEMYSDKSERREASLSGA